MRYHFRLKFWEIYRHFQQLHALLRAVALILLIQSGCVHYEPQPVSPVKTAESFWARTLTNTDLHSYVANAGVSDPWPPESWDLNGLTLAALFYHPDLDVARAKWGTAQAAKRTAAEHPNPVLSAAPAYNSTTAIPSPWLVTASLDIPIETAGKRGYRMLQANELSEAARRNITTAAWQVRSRLRKALVDLYTAREAETLLKEQQQIQGDLLRLLEAQREAGVVSTFELTQARITSDTMRLALHDVERQSAEAFIQVADAIGITAAALSQVQLSFVGIAEIPDGVPTEEIRRQALLSRTDILAALNEYRASEAALQLEIAKQYPDVHLAPGYEFDQGDNKWSLGLSLTLPVLNQNKGVIAEAKAKRTEAAAAFLALQSRLIGELDRAVAAYQVTLQKMKDAKAIEENLRTQEKTAQGMFTVGEISKSELAGLRLQLSASALARLDTLAKAQLAFQQLEDAVQRPLTFRADLWERSPRQITGAQMKTIIR